MSAWESDDEAVSHTTDDRGLDRAHDETDHRPRQQSAGARARIRILLVDDHQLVRESLAALLGRQPDFDIIGQAEDGRMAVDLARSLLPEVVVMDVSMPELNGIEATRLIMAELPNTRVIGLSLHEEEDMAEAMHEAGAVAYLTKGGPVDELRTAIRHAGREA